MELVSLGTLIAKKKKSTRKACKTLDVYTYLSYAINVDYSYLFLIMYRNLCLTLPW
jgi:hypothetical protein